MAPKLKLIYFGLPGRAEATRLMAKHAGLDLEDTIVTREQWPELKPTTPFGQLPVLEVDGKPLAQTAAIERFVAKLAGLTPEDAWEAAQVDQVVAFLQEAYDLITPTWSLPPEEQKKKREEIVAGPLKAKLKKLADLLAASGGPYITGSNLTYADFVLHNQLSMLSSGFINHIPTDLVSKDFPTLKEHHARIAGLPGVVAFYKDVTDGVRLAYKSLP